nr:hypothetical protein P5660_14930 [Bacillus velezensis]
MSVFKNQETYWENLFDEEDGLSAFPYFKAADKASLAVPATRKNASAVPYLRKYLKES